MIVFFQAEDGIRDVAVTGVQTCALPISRARGEEDGGAVLPGRPRVRLGPRREPGLRGEPPDPRRGAAHVRGPPDPPRVEDPGPRAGDEQRPGLRVPAPARGPQAVARRKRARKELHPDLRGSKPRVLSVTPRARVPLSGIEPLPAASHAAILRS